MIASEDDARHLRDQVVAVPSDGRVILVSALSILEKENSGLCERCIAFLADRFGTPPVPVSSFERNPDIVGRFPAEMLRVRGAVPFARIGDVVLVALLNPADERLRERLSEVAKCRFYTTLPSSAEAWLDAAFGGGVSA